MASREHHFRTHTLKIESSLSIMTHAYTPITWELESGGSGAKAHFWLYNKFETSLGYMRLYLGKSKLIN